MASGMAKTSRSNWKIQALEVRKDVLESSLLDVNLIKLAVELSRHKVITKKTKENFASMDPDHLESDIKVRYLLQQVCERVREDEKVYDRLVNALSKVGGGVRGVCQAMRGELEEVKAGKVRNDTEESITEENIPYLIKILVPACYKWESIGIALHLPKHKLVSCGRGEDDIVRLNNILTTWVLGNHEKTGSASLENLKTALQMVDFGNLAFEIEKTNLSKQHLSEDKKPHETSSTPEVTYQSCDSEVSEGKSTLLEVWVSCNGCEAYQWSKDGQPLLDGADFSGVSSNILYINTASQGTEGRYSCIVSNGRETVCSDEIKLRVLKLSLKKVDLVKLSDCFMNNNFISKCIYEKFSSLDQNYLNQDLRFRYLYQQVVDSVKEDSKLYDRLDTVLSELDGILKDVVEIIKSRIDKNIHRPVMKYSSRGDGQCCGTEDDQLRQEDCPHLVQLLLCGGDKWELIGKALTLPEQIIVRGKDLQDNCSRLFHILTAWISGNYEDAKPATFNVLKKVLSYELINLPLLVEGGNVLRSCTQISVVPVGVSSGSFLEIECQSYDTEISEGKSTLLEVQVSCNRCESYQWSKDGQRLLDGADFSGVFSNILYINRASQGSEGKYSCIISNGRETVCSDDIDLKVLYPPEKKHLLDLYSLMESEVPKDSWPPVSSSTFINLVLVKQGPISKRHYYTVRGDMDDILESKEEVSYEEVFSEYKEGALVLVEGRPGCGKTTLVHKVTRDWAKCKNVLQGAQLVFLVTLRVLNFTGKDKCLSDILEEFFHSEVIRKRVECDLQEYGGRGACFIFDGLDEYQHKNEEGSVIYQFIYKKYLPFSMIIVASRPIATEGLKNYCARRVEVMGFTKSQIYKYVETYPFISNSKVCGSDMVSNLEKYLHQHPNVLHMCYLPVHVAMICFLFSELGDNIPHTETQVYEQFTIATLLRQKKRRKGLQQLKLKDLEGKEKENFQSICQLAFDMIIKSQQVISQSEVPACLSDSTSSVLSLLTVEHTYRTHGDEHLYSFHHLTFQEFLAACHIAELEEQEQIRIIKKYRFKTLCYTNNNEDGVDYKKIENTIKFYCGLLGRNQSIVLKNKKILKYLFSEDSLGSNEIQCAFESQCVGVCDYVVGDGCISIGFGFGTPSDFTALGYVISSSSKFVYKLSLERCSWISDGVKALSCMDMTSKLHLIQCLEVFFLNDSEDLPGLLSQLPGLQELYFYRLSEEEIKSFTSNVELSQLKTSKIKLPLKRPCSNPEEVLKLLRFGSHNIERVYIYMDSTDTPYNFALWRKWLHYAFFQGLVNSDISWVYLYNSDTFSSLCPERFSYCTEVVLVNCNIDDEGAEILASTLNTSVLENIVLDFNRISDSGAVALAGCMQRCSVLQEVCMECNFIGDSGATALASALFDCSSLRRLDLQGNAISDEGAVALAKVAEDKPQLDFYLHNIGISEGVKKILELRSRTAVRSMKFSSSWEAISEAGIDTLRRALKCGSLPTLKISDNNINNIKIVVEETECLRNVKKLESDFYVYDDTLPALCDIICSMNSLEYLQCRLEYFIISSAGRQHFIDILRSCRYLHSLSLKESYYSSFLMDTVKCCSNIHTLKLDCSLDSDAMTQLFSDHKSWFNLHTLDLNHNKIGSNGVQVLSKVLAYCNNLCFLDLGNNHIDDRGCSYLSDGLQDHTHLLGVTLASNKEITSDGVVALIPVIRKNHLQELDLSFCNIDSEGVAALMEVICTNTLQTLKLCSVGMGLEGVVALSAGLKNCRQLVEIDISFNNIGSHGMSFLAEGLQYCTNLQALHPSDFKITSNFIPAIASITKTCKYLKYLNLRCNTVSVDDIANLVVGWQHKNALKLDWFPDDPHRIALFEGNGCCSSCDHLLEVYSNNDYIIIPNIPKVITSS